MRIARKAIIVSEQKRLPPGNRGRLRGFLDRLRVNRPTINEVIDRLRVNRPTINGFPTRPVFHE